MYVKYPRTYHLPWSPGRTSDDKVLKDVSCFVGKEVIVLEKMDGENTTMYNDHIHARSINSKHHPSRDWVKQLHAEIRHDIPDNYRICGENLYAKHSIHYQNLPSYFMVFSVWEGSNALSWDDTVTWCQLLNLHHVPVIWRGLWDEKAVKQAFEDYTSKATDEVEGYVVRLAESFSIDTFRVSVAKYVRKDHVQTDDHWMHKDIICNRLR